MILSPLALPALLLSLTLPSSLASQAPSYTPFGTGCPGSAGTPVLRASHNDLPLLGQIFTSEVRNLPFLSAGIGITGLSNGSWGTQTLPLQLTPFGMAGCTLYTEIRSTRALFTSPGLATWSMVIPNDPALVGQAFYQQAFIIDSTVPGLGAVMSNGARGVIGVLPDLEVVRGTVSVTPLTISAGTAVMVSPFTVRNLGNGSSPTFQCGYYLSQDSIISSADKFVAARQFPPLAASASVRTSTLNLHIAPGITPGNYWLGILADWNHRVIELDEGNNYDSTRLTITAALPDLQISNGIPSVSPSTVEQGRQVRVASTTVRNAGHAVANSFSVGYYISPNTTISRFDLLLYQVNVTGLGTGVSTVLPSHSLTIPLSQAIGTYHIGILVDNLNAVPELNEGNNSVERPITVTRALPDLYPLSTPSVLPNPIVGYPFIPSPFRLGSFQVRNSGLVWSGSFRIGIYLSSNSIISPNDRLLGTVSVSSISPGGTVTINSRLMHTPFGQAPGSYYLGVYVDDQKVRPESNENNNSRGRSVIIL